ncbi:MAG: hypothetical protein AABY07_05945 [Nanoarchaeota archaeon]
MNGLHFESANEKRRNGEMSSGRLGKINSVHQNENISQNLKNFYQSAEAQYLKEKFRNDLIKRWEDPKYKELIGQKISISLTGRKATEQAKYNMSNSHLGQKQSEESKKKKSVQMIEKWKDENFQQIRHNSLLNYYENNYEEARLLRSQQSKERWANEKFKRETILAIKKGCNTPEAKGNRSKSAIKRWENPIERAKIIQAIEKGLAIKPTQPEKYLITIIKELKLYFKYCGDLSFWIGRKNPDFVNIKSKKLIELFGDYWHKGDNGRKRMKYFAKHGYRTLIIWEHELKDLNIVKAKLLAFNSL